MNEFRITVRCQREPAKHAKILRLKSEQGRQYADTLASLLDGSSPLFIHKPGPDSPIGKCATCGGGVEASVEEVEVKEHGKAGR